MVPVVVLIVVTVAARLVGAGVPYLASWPAATVWGLAAAFLIASTAHFLQPRRAGLVAIVPPWMPHPSLVVTISGILEVAGAVGLIFEPTRVVAAACLGLLLILIFPPNVRAARTRLHPAAPTTPLLLRSVIQVVFLAACVVSAL